MTKGYWIAQTETSPDDGLHTKPNSKNKWHAFLGTSQCILQRNDDDSKAWQVAEGVSTVFS